MRRGAMPWLSTMLTNLGVARFSSLRRSGSPALSFLLLYLPIVLSAPSIGVWLFYVQHQFERTYWEHDADWSHPDAALHGSSFYDLPRR